MGSNKLEINDRVRIADGTNRLGTVRGISTVDGTADVLLDDGAIETHPNALLYIQLGHGVSRDKAEHDAVISGYRDAFAQLRDAAGKIERARIAEIGANAFEVARALGIDLPALVRKVLGAAAFYAPTIKLLPTPKGSPGYKAAIDIIVEAIELLARVFDVKGR